MRMHPVQRSRTGGVSVLRGSAPFSPIGIFVHFHHLRPATHATPFLFPSLFLSLFFFLAAAAAQAQPLPSIESKSAGLEKLDGYFPMYWDADADLPALTDILDRVSENVWKTVAAESDYEAELARIVQQVWTDELLALAQTKRLAPAVRARTNLHLSELHAWLAKQRTHRDTEELAHRAQVYDELERYFARDYEPGAQKALPAPPGSPIGTAEPAFVSRTSARRQQLDRYDVWMQACGE